MTLEQIKNFPTSRNGKMAYGIFAALVARESLNTGITLMDTNSDGALAAFLMTGVLVYTIVLAVIRYDSGKPLFEAVGRS